MAVQQFSSGDELGLSGEAADERTPRHLTPLRARFFLAALPPLERDALPHLLECGRCRRLVASLSLEAPGDWLPGHAPMPSAYTAILERLEQRSLALATVVVEEREAAEPLLTELLAVPAGRWAGLVRSRAGFRTFAFAARLVEESYGLGFQDPRRAEALARLALTILGALDTTRTSETAVADLSAQAWALIGSFLGMRRNWARAEQAFRMAEQMLRTPESVEAGAFCRLLAAVRRGQRRYIEALALTERAGRLFEEAGDACGETTAATEQGELYLTLGELEKGLAHIARARLFFEPALYNTSALRTRLGLALSYLDLEHFAEAEALLAEEGDQGAIPAPLRVQVRIARARVAIARGREHEAEAVLAAARSEAETEGALDEAWLAAIDLAGLYLRSGHLEELAALVSGMRRFEATLAREPREAVARLRRAAVGRQASAELIAEVAEVLARFYSGGQDDVLVTLFRQYGALFPELEAGVPE